MRGTRKQIETIMNQLNKAFISQKKVSTINIYFENVQHSKRDYGGFGKMILAKGIADKTQGRIIGIMPYDEQYNKFLQVLGGRIDCGDKFSLWDKIEVFFRMFFIQLTCKSVQDIVELQCRGICIGDLIYNTIVRSNRNIVTINKVEIFKYKDIFKKAVSWTVSYDKKFYKVKPEYYIGEEPGYIQAVIARAAAKHGARVIQYLMCSPCSYIERFGMGYYYDWNTVLRERLENVMEVGKIHQIAKGYADKIFKEIDVFTLQVRLRQGKMIKKKEDILVDIGINNTKKNILIMLHCFSDNPCGKFNGIYKDYYEWYIETLRIIKELNKVNWIIKPHPARGDYYEKNIAEKIFEEYKGQNIFWLSDEYGPEIIPDLADAIVTVSGTAGVEYSAFGIPCVVTGNPFYADFGYTINVDSIPKYKDVLKNMHRIHRLTPTQIQMAEVVLYLYKERCIEIYERGFEGLFYNVLNKIYKGKRDEDINQEFISELSIWMEQNDIKDSYLYKFGYESAK